MSIITSNTNQLMEIKNADLRRHIRIHGKLFLFSAFARAKAECFSREYVCF